MMMTTAKKEYPRWPLTAAEIVALEIVGRLKDACTMICIAGSIRRRKTTVKDVEIVYVPRIDIETDIYSLGLTPIHLNRAEEKILELESCGMLSRRLNSKGYETYGPHNKLMVHHPSDLPVDLFATTEECWFNYLVCRTGPAELNRQIAIEARRRGYDWHPYGPGFIRPSDGQVVRVASEEEVFDIAGIQYLEPEQRG